MPARVAMPARRRRPSMPMRPPLAVEGLSNRRSAAGPGWTWPRRGRKLAVMKIAFLGTHGVGKTTLCFELAACLKRLDLGVDVVKEVARSCPLPINRETTEAAQAWILHTQIAREIELGHRYQAIVCDRAVLDNYAYMVHAAGRRAELEPLIAAWMGTYTLLVKVPVIAPPSYDGTRDVSVTFQQEIDRLIDELLDAFNLPRLVLTAGQRDGWIAAVLERLGLPLHPPQLELFNQAGGQAARRTVDRAAAAAARRPPSRNPANAPQGEDQNPYDRT